MMSGNSPGTMSGSERTRRRPIRDSIQASVLSKYSGPSLALMRLMIE